MFSGGLTTFGIICGSVYGNNGQGRWQGWKGAGERPSFYRLAGNTTDGPPTASHKTLYSYIQQGLKLSLHNIHLNKYK